jgi:hypothetical protein
MSFIIQSLLTSIPLHYTYLFLEIKGKKLSKQTLENDCTINGSYGGQNMESDFKNGDQDQFNLPYLCWIPKLHYMQNY